MIKASEGSQDLNRPVRKEVEEADCRASVDQPKDPHLGDSSGSGYSGYGRLSSPTPRLARAREPAVPPAALTQLCPEKNSRLGGTKAGTSPQQPARWEHQGMEVRALTFHPSQMLGGSGGAQLHTQQVRRVHGVSQIQSVGREPGQKGGGAGRDALAEGCGAHSLRPGRKQQQQKNLPECSGDNADFRGS